MKKIIVIIQLVMLYSCAPQEYMRLTTAREREMSLYQVRSSQLQYRPSHDITLVRDTVSRKFEVDNRGRLKILPTDTFGKIFFSKDSLCIKNGNYAVFDNRQLPLGTYRVGKDSFIIIALRDRQFYNIDGKQYQVFIGDAIAGKNNHGKVPHILYQKICEPGRVKNLETVKGRTVY